MKKIILLRFHKDTEIVQNRIDLLKKFNKGIEIHGLFGGSENNFVDFQLKLKGLSSILQVSGFNKDALWKRSDESILFWFKNIGVNLNFDVVYTIEYDLIYLDAIEKLFDLPDKAIALTGLINLRDIKENWDWIDESPYKEESHQFLDFINEKYDLKENYACLGPGSTLTREFLEMYLSTNIPSISHDELRLPQLANAFRIKMVDTNFYNNWNGENPITETVFNCNKEEISVEKVLEEYSKGLRKVFHPVYEILPLSILK